MIIVLDSNIYLHYHKFYEIDWSSIVGNETVTILILPMNINELDNAKHNAPNVKVRKRAQEIIGNFRDIKTGGLSCENIDFQFPIIHTQDINWIEMNLDQSNNDDIIIASILILSNKLNEKITLITADFGMELKADFHKIDHMTIPNEYKREDSDTRDKKIQSLTSELQKVTEKLPKIDLYLSVSDDEMDKFQKLSLNECKSNILTDDDIKMELQKIKDNTIPITGEVKESFLIVRSYIPEGEVERYNNDLNEYVTKFEEYLLQLQKFQYETAIIFEVAIILTNDGNTPAEDIDIYLKFPDDVEIIKKENLPIVPSKPKEPVVPQPFGIGSTLFPSALLDLSPFPMIQPVVGYAGIANQSGPDIDNKTNEVEYWVYSLKHKLNWYPEPIFIKFKSLDDVENVKIVYNVHIGNYPETVTGTLGLVFDKK